MVAQEVFEEAHARQAVELLVDAIIARSLRPHRERMLVVTDLVGRGGTKGIGDWPSVLRVKLGGGDACVGSEPLVGDKDRRHPVPRDPNKHKLAQPSAQSAHSVRLSTITGLLSALTSCVDARGNGPRPGLHRVHRVAPEPATNGLSATSIIASHGSHAPSEL